MLNQNDLDFNVKAVCSLSIFKDSGIECSWNTIKTGWDLQRLTVEEISLFALDYMEANPGLVNMYISEVIFGVKYYEMDEYLEKIFTSLNLYFPEKDECLWNQEWRKWRFCILNTMVSYIKDEEQLLQEIEGLIADFRYPFDMKPFYLYMPVSGNPDDLSKYENYDYLIKRINSFLRYEKVLIETGYRYLPEKLD